MELMKAIDTLFKVDNVLKDHGINYMVTGTTALGLLGFLTPGQEPGDIDILVLEPLTDVQFKLLKALQICSPEAQQHNDYPDAAVQNLHFLIDDVKVNVLSVLNLGPAAIATRYANERILINLGDRLIPIQRVIPAVRDKMNLGRAKDQDWLLSVIKTLCDL